jgi:hypothetical protein
MCSDLGRNVLWKSLEREPEMVRTAYLVQFLVHPFPEPVVCEANCKGRGQLRCVLHRACVLSRAVKLVRRGHLHQTGQFGVQA